MAHVTEAHKIRCEMFLLCLFLEMCSPGNVFFDTAVYLCVAKCVLKCADNDTRNVFGFEV